MFEDLEPLHPEDKQKPIPASRMYYDDMSMPRSISDLNLEEELVQHYTGVKAYLMDLSVDSEKASASQVAQVTNSLTSVLDKIIKMRESVVNMERMAKVESAMVDALKTAPADIQDKFFAEYEKILKQYEK